MSEPIVSNESAIQYFNQEAEKLIDLLTELHETDTGRQPIGSVREEISLNIDESEVQYSFKTQDDHKGNEAYRYFYVSPNKWVGLDAQRYPIFRKLLGSLYKRKELNEIISEGTLTEIIFYWMKTKYEKSENAPSTLMEYIEKAVKEKIKNIKISIPISFLAIDSEFEIGNVKFEYFKKELFDKIELKMKEGVETKKISEREVADFMQKLRKDYQGKACGTVHVRTEEEKAKEVAEREVERAIMALKYFSPSALYPKNTASFGRKGISHLPMRYIFIYFDDIPNLFEGIVTNQPINFNINNRLLERIKKDGLDELSDLIKKNDLSEFEELLLTAIHTFTRAISYYGYHEKIVFILSALEIIFLKDSGEPIQISVGQRLGFFIDQGPDRRREAVLLINDAYKIRSNFIHHGQEKEDYEILGKLQLACWKALNIMIKNHDKFKNKQEFMLFIERLIYS